LVWNLRIKPVKKKKYNNNNNDAPYVIPGG
jgi:hypothetical protein